MWRMQAAVDCGSWELFVSEAKQPVQYFFPMAAIGISYDAVIRLPRQANKPGQWISSKGYESFVVSGANFVTHAKQRQGRQRGKTAMLWLHTRSQHGRHGQLYCLASLVLFRFVAHGVPNLFQPFGF